MAVLVTVSISIGGLVEIVPMYTAAFGEGTPNPDLRYTPLELAGRDIYVREGCYNCHSQMVRPFRAETLRYGEWSRAEEYAFDRPFQLGSRRIGPDLARVGGKYPDAWHFEHIRNPRSTSPGSIMPNYPWIIDSDYDYDDVAASVRAMARLGVPYTDEEVADPSPSIREQASGIVESLSGSGIDTRPEAEIVALIAYLQHLGTGLDALASEGGVQ